MKEIYAEESFHIVENPIRKTMTKNSQENWREVHLFQVSFHTNVYISYRCVLLLETCPTETH